MSQRFLALTLTSVLGIGGFGAGACGSDGGTGGRGGTGGATGGSGGSGGSGGGFGGSGGGFGGSGGGTGGSGGGTGGSGGGTGGSGGAGGAGGTAGRDAGGGSGGGGTGGTAGRDGGGGSGGGGTGGTAGRDGGGGGAGGASGTSPMMTFFITSRGAGKGGDLRATPADTDGLAGADALCKSLAMAALPELGNKTWRAYLSTSTVSARMRLTGGAPWRNAKGVVIAMSVDQLHDNAANMINYTNGLDERGNVLPGVMRPAGTSNQHDVLTGTMANGMVAGNNHCNNWTSTMGNSWVGHHDKMGGGQNNWNSAHMSGCAEGTGGGSVGQGGGRGSFYCFAVD